MNKINIKLSEIYLDFLFNCNSPHFFINLIVSEYTENYTLKTHLKMSSKNALKIQINVF